jgi:hypothetical protein
LNCSRNSHGYIQIVGFERLDRSAADSSGFCEFILAELEQESDCSEELGMNDHGATFGHRSLLSAIAPHKILVALFHIFTIGSSRDIFLRA